MPQKHRAKELGNCQLVLDGTIVTALTFVKNLGVYLDKSISMEQHIAAVSKSCFNQIRNIGRIRSYITDSACKTLVCSLITSRLDYGNALLYGVNASTLAKLKRVQNTAARLMARRKKYDHITPLLIELHWLPVKFRCEYKLLVYVFKSLHGIAPVYLQDCTSRQDFCDEGILWEFRHHERNKVVWCSTIQHGSFYSLEQSSRWLKGSRLCWYVLF